MAATQAQAGIIRTGRGLSIAGTRITLYDILDYVKADWPPKLIQQWLNLTDPQIDDALAYIATHRDEVEAEYQLIIEQAEAARLLGRAQSRALGATLGPAATARSGRGH